MSPDTKLTPNQRAPAGRAVSTKSGVNVLLLVERGREMMDLFDLDGYEEAVFFFREAIQADPMCAAAYAGLSETYGLWAFRREICGLESESLYAMAFQFAETALRLDSDLAQAHRAMAIALRRGPNANPEKRKQEIESAMKLDSKDADTLYEYWRIRGYEPEDPILTEAIELDPNLCGPRIDLGVVYCQMGRLDDAERELREALRINSKNALAQYDLAMVQSQQGKHQEAIDRLRQAQIDHPGDQLLENGIRFLTTMTSADSGNDFNEEATRGSDA